MPWKLLKAFRGFAVWANCSERSNAEWIEWHTLYKVNLSCECISFSIMCGCVFGQQNFIFNGCARCHFRSVVIVKIKSNPQQFENYARVRFSLKLNAVRELFFICGMKNTEEKYLHFKCISQQNIYWHAKQEKEEKKLQQPHPITWIALTLLHFFVEPFFLVPHLCQGILNAWIVHTELYIQLDFTHSNHTV